MIVQGPVDVRSPGHLRGRTSFLPRFDVVRRDGRGSLGWRETNFGRLPKGSKNLVKI